MMKKELQVRRLGHPKLCWISLAMKNAWYHIKGHIDKKDVDFDENNPDIIHNLEQAAKAHLF